MATAQTKAERIEEILRGLPYASIYEDHEIENVVGWSRDASMHTYLLVEFLPSEYHTHMACMNAGKAETIERGAMEIERLLTPQEVPA